MIDCFTTYLLEGNVTTAALCSFDQPFQELVGATSGYYIVGILFLLGMALLYITNRSISFSFVVSLIVFVPLFLFIPTIFKRVIITILVLELGGIIYAWTR